MGMFQEVKEMNAAFGNAEGNKEDLVIGESGVLTAPQAIAWKRLEKQCKNIVAEYKELMDCIEERDIEGVRDALCDINVFSLGAHHLMGHDADADMSEVVGALFSRFCVDQKHLDETSDYYLRKGVHHYYEGEFPRKCLKSSHDQGLTTIDGQEVWEYPQGKFLKALGYRQPVFK